MRQFCRLLRTRYPEATVIQGGMVKNHKGVNLPDTVLPIPALTPKDREDLAFALRIGVNWVALSFVQRAADMAELRRLVGGKAAAMGLSLFLVMLAMLAFYRRIVARGSVLCDTKRQCNLTVEQRRLGYVPQDCALFPNLTARQNVEFARRCRRECLSSAQAEELAG